MGDIGQCCMQLLIHTSRTDSGNSVLKTIKFKLQDIVDTFHFRQLLMDKVEWRGGWPVVGSPSSAKQLKPSVDNEV